LCIHITILLRSQGEKHKVTGKKLATRTELRSSFHSGFYHRPTQTSLIEISRSNIQKVKKMPSTMLGKIIGTKSKIPTVALPMVKEKEM